MKKNMKKNMKKLLRTIVSDQLFIKIQGIYHVGYIFNLKKPKTFNEKIQYRKLNDKNPLFSKCSCKYSVRDYVKNRIGKKYLIPLYLSKEKLIENDFEKLPNNFVIKNTHGGGGNGVQVVKDKKQIVYKDIVKRFNDSLRIKHGYNNLEFFYDEIEPKIIIEKLLLDKNGNIPEDYKIHCFPDKEKYFIQVLNREKGKLKMAYFDLEWNHLNFETGGMILQKTPIKPKNLELMINLAKKLSKDFDYSRIDFYNLDGEIYFGEITFCPFGGLQKFNPKEWDMKFGDYWNQRVVKNDK